MQQSGPPQQQPAYGTNDLTVITYRKRSLEMCPVLDQELRQLVSGYSSAYLALFGITLGACVTLVATLCAVSLPDTLGTRFFDAALITGLFSLVLGVLAVRDWLESRQVMSQITRETVSVSVVQGEAGKGT